MLQRKLALKAFLESAGFKILAEELATFYAHSDKRVINRYVKPVGLDEIAGLNYDLGEKAGLQKVLNILEGFRDELMDKSSGGT